MVKQVKDDKFSGVDFSCADSRLQGKILLADHSLDRQGYQRRQGDYINSLRQSGDSRYLLMRGDEFACRDRAVCLLHVDDIHNLRLSTVPALFIGLQPAVCDASIFAIKIDRQQPLPELQWPLQWLNLRELAIDVSRAMANLLATAQGLLFWHDNHRYCGRCGHAAQLTLAGHGRRCTNSACAHDTYPRLDPAVIVLVTRDDHCLLARGSRWPEKRFSCLAGFVEAGEAIEDTVRREVYEEVGLRLDQVHYQASQPWPFPTVVDAGILCSNTGTGAHFSRWRNRRGSLVQCRSVATGHPQQGFTGFQFIVDILSANRLLVSATNRRQAGALTGGLTDIS